MNPLPDPIPAAVEACESHAAEEFEDDAESFTQITKWEDGDFRVLVWHGMSHERAPYRQDGEKVTYRHYNGEIVYAKVSRYIDRHLNETHESRVLERPDFAPEFPPDDPPDE